jgi:broad specificity phosphatase PhoE
MESSEPKIELKENMPDFDLAITITRHGPKQGQDGPLSEEGKQETDEYFSDAYEGVAIDTNRKRRVIASPKERANQTAHIYQGVLERNNGVDSVEIETEEFLNEGDVMIFINSLSEEEQKNWFKYWQDGSKELPPNAPSFKNVVRDFSSWLLKEINAIKTTGGNLDIDAFSHGPLMGAVLLSLEDELGEEIITSYTSGDERINRIKMLDIYNGQLGALRNINFYINSKNSNIIKLSVLGKIISIPIEVFEKFARNK